MEHKTIGFGGGCHWCTESYFHPEIHSWKGVIGVEQGWVKSTPPNESFSEAVLVNYIQGEASLHQLIEIHLHTHACTSNHSFRQKYRSAIYYFDDEQKEIVQQTIIQLQNYFEENIITEVLPFIEFKHNIDQQKDYYLKNRGNQFCDRYIEPKLKQLKDKYRC